MNFNPQDTATLINDLITANTTDGPHEIVLNAGQVYSITAPHISDFYTGLPRLSGGKEITINGNGATIRRNSAQEFRLFKVESGTTLHLNNLNISEGYISIAGSEGGAIYVDESTLHVNAVTFSSNRATYRGGAIYARSSDVECVGTVFEGNGGIYDTNSGGAIHIENNGGSANLRLDDVRFSANSAAYNGGAFFTRNTNVDCTNSVFENNRASSGGALHVYGSNLDLDDVTFRSNQGDRSGGSVHAVDASVNCTNCNFEGNQTLFTTGGGSSDAGGAIYVRGGSLDIDETTFNSNEAGKLGGAVYAENTNIACVNSAFKSNKVIDQTNSNTGAFHLDTSVTGYINKCNLLGNGGYAISFPLGSSSFNAVNNLWNGIGGPSGEGSGIGDAVGFNVNYQPFQDPSAPSDHEGDPDICGAGADSRTIGNPISTRLGEKRLKLTDWRINTVAGELTFTRSYRQGQSESDLARMGLGWRHNHAIYLTTSINSPVVNGDTITVHFPMGTVLFTYNTTDGYFRGNPGATAYVRQLTSTYELIASDGSKYIFDADGDLFERVWSNSEVWKYQYSTGSPKKLLSVSDDTNYGRYLQFAYDTSNRLWRVGDHTSGTLSGTPTNRYLEFVYATGSGGSLLSEMKDVRVVNGGPNVVHSWTYHYYGQNPGETDPDLLDNLLVRRAPIVDADGDGVDDTTIVLESLTYKPNGQLGEIHQSRGDGAIVSEMQFNQSVSGNRTKTTETIGGQTATYYFDTGVYTSMEDPESHVMAESPDSSYRTATQVDPNNNATVMSWSDDGKQLQSINDAVGQTTRFGYLSDDSNRLAYNVDAEGRRTTYIYDDNRRQPGTIVVSTAEPIDIVSNGDMEATTGWNAVGSPSTNTQVTDHTIHPIEEGDAAWHVMGDQNEGIESDNLSLVADRSYLISAQLYVNGPNVQMQLSGVSDPTAETTRSQQWEVVHIAYRPTVNETKILQFVSTDANADFYVDKVRVIEVADALQWQSFIYDNRQRTLYEALVSVETGRVQNATSRTFGTNGLLESITVEDTRGEGNSESTSYTYDPVDKHRVIKTQRSSLYGSCSFTYTVFDEAGQVVATVCHPKSVTIPTTVQEAQDIYTNASVADKAVTTVTLYEYDAIGRRTKVTQNAASPDEHTNLTLYDGLDRVIQTVSNFVAESDSGTVYTAPKTWTFDVTDKVWKDQNGIEIEHGADSNENVISTTDYNARGAVRQTTDVFGVITLYGYSNAGRLIKTVHNASRRTYVNDFVTGGDASLGSYTPETGADSAVQDIVTEQRYDAAGNPVQSIDPNGVSTFTIYDGLNRPVKTIRAAKTSATLEYEPGDGSYNATNDPHSDAYVVNPDPDRDLIDETVYDALGRVTRTQRLTTLSAGEPVWETTLYGYDGLGRQVRTIRQASQPTYNTLGDPSLSNYPISDQPDQDIVTDTVYDAAGRVRYTVDTNGVKTWNVYDGMGRQVRTVQNALGTADAIEDTSQPYKGALSDPAADLVSETVYDDGRVQKTRRVLKTNAQGTALEWAWTFHGYDEQGRQVKTIQNASNTAYNINSDKDLSGYIVSGNSDEDIVAETVYDTLGRVQKTIDNLANVTLYGYDSDNRRVKTVTNASNPTYDATADERLASYVGSSSDPDQDRVTTTTYGLGGRVTQTKDTAGRVTYFVYDDLGRRVYTITNYEQGNTGPDNWRWSNANNRWEDGNGQQIDHHSTGTAFDQNHISETTYNSAGQVTQNRDPHGVLTTFVYDTAGRRQTVSRASGTAIAMTDYTVYDKAGRVLRTIRNYVAQGSPETNPADWYWNGTGWQYSESDTTAIVHNSTMGTNDQNLVTEYVYDRIGRRTQMIDPERNVTETEYAKDGTILSVTDVLAYDSDGDGTPDEDVITAYRYDALNRRTMVVANYTATSDPTTWSWNETSNVWEAQ